MKNFASGTWIPGEVSQGEKISSRDKSLWYYIFASIFQMLVGCLLNVFAVGELLHVPTRPQIGALLHFSLKENLFPVGML